MCHDSYQETVQRRRIAWYYQHLPHQKSVDGRAQGLCWPTGKISRRNHAKYKRNCIQWIKWHLHEWIGQYYLQPYEIKDLASIDLALVWRWGYHGQKFKNNSQTLWTLSSLGEFELQGGWAGSDARGTGLLKYWEWSIFGREYLSILIEYVVFELDMPYLYIYISLLNNMDLPVLGHPINMPTMEETDNRA